MYARTRFKIIAALSLLLLTACAPLAVGTATAQTRPSHSYKVPDAFRQLVKEEAEMEKSLKLTPGQLAKRKVIEAKYRRQLIAHVQKSESYFKPPGAVKQDAATVERLRQAKLKATQESIRILGEKTREIYALYTPEQQAKLTVFKKRMQKRFLEQKPPRGG